MESFSYSILNMLEHSSNQIGGTLFFDVLSMHPLLVCPPLQPFFVMTPWPLHYLLPTTAFTSMTSFTTIASYVAMSEVSALVSSITTGVSPTGTDPTPQPSSFTPPHWPHLSRWLGRQLWRSGAVASTSTTTLSHATKT